MSLSKQLSALVDRFKIENGTFHSMSTFGVGYYIEELKLDGNSIGWIGSKVPEGQESEVPGNDAVWKFTKRTDWDANIANAELIEFRSKDCLMRCVAVNTFLRKIDGRVTTQEAVMPIRAPIVLSVYNVELCALDKSPQSAGAEVYFSCMVKMLVNRGGEPDEVVESAVLDASNGELVLKNGIVIRATNIGDSARSVLEAVASFINE